MQCSYTAMHTINTLTHTHHTHSLHMKHTHAHIHTFMYTHVHTHVQTRTRTHTYTHTHTRARLTAGCMVRACCISKESYALCQSTTLEYIDRHSLEVTFSVLKAAIRTFSIKPLSVYTFRTVRKVPLHSAIDTYHPPLIRQRAEEAVSALVYSPP